jgi:predicted AlkP superfamily phosphohydrolase/phosphomutase
VDAALGKILDQLDRDDAGVLVFALNGMSHNYGQDHLILPFIDRLNREFSRSEGLQLSPPPRRNLTRVLREFVPTRLQQATGQYSPIWLRDEIVNRIYTGGRRWDETPALNVRGDLHSYIRFNLRGRESRGFLDPESDQMCRYRNLLRDCLLELSDANSGDRLVRDVHFAGELFPGPRSDRLPDVIVTFRDIPPTTHAISKRLGDFHQSDTTHRSGAHTPRGFCFALRPFPAVANPGSIGSMLDFAPTVLQHYQLAHHRHA